MAIETTTYNTLTNNLTVNLATADSSATKQAGSGATGSVIE